jgi:GGDEF domain-containing protein
VAAQQSGEPVSLISVSLAANGTAPGKLAPLLRSRLRHADRLCRLDAQRFLVVAPDTDQQTAEALAADLRRHARREAGVAAEVDVEVETATADASAAELLERISTAQPPLHAPVPSD